MLQKIAIGVGKLGLLGLQNGVNWGCRKWGCWFEVAGLRLQKLGLLRL